MVGRRLLVRDVITEYRDLRDRSRPISDSSTEHYTLNHLVDGLGERDVMSLNAQDLAGYCQMRRDEGAGPYTMQHGHQQAGHGHALRGHVAQSGAA